MAGKKNGAPGLVHIQTSGMEFVRTSGGIEEYRMPGNGLRVLFMEQRTAPVAAVLVTYRVGSRHEGLGLTGATHFLEHLMFKGTARFNKKSGTSIFNVLQRVGALVNATTWFDRTNYYELLPSAYLDLALQIEADRMRNALIDPADMESERTVILNELDRGENEPTRRLHHAVWSAAFQAHPYHHPTIGWRSDVENVRREVLKQFYDTYYWPNNATLSIIGDADRADVLEKVEAFFGGIEASPQTIPQTYTVEPPQYGERRIVLRRPGLLGAIKMAYKSPKGSDPDADALDLLAIVLAWGKNSRLYKALTDAGLTSHVFASNARLRDPGLFTLTAMLAPGKSHAEVEETLRTSLAEIVQEEVSEKELDRARNHMIAQEAFGRDGPFLIAAHLNEAIAVGDWTLFTTYLDRIRGVTSDDLNRVARTYFTDDGLTTGLYVPVTEPLT